MSLILRQESSEAGVRALGSDQASPTPARDPRLVALEDDVRALEGQIERMRQRHERELTEAADAARLSAIASFERDEAQALERLNEAIETAHAGLQDRLRDLDALALEAACAALAPLLGQTSDYRPLLERAVATQIKDIEASLIASIVVSGADFPDAASLRAWSEAYPHVKVSNDPALERGVCRIALKLGEIEVSIPRYWSELSARIATLAKAAAPL